MGCAMVLIVGLLQDISAGLPRETKASKPISGHRLTRAPFQAGAVAPGCAAANLARHFKTRLRRLKTAQDDFELAPKFISKINAKSCLKSNRS